MDVAPEHCLIERPEAGAVSIVRCPASDVDAEWMKSVAADLKGRVLFIWPAQEGKVTKYALEHGVEAEWNDRDDTAVANAKPTSEEVWTSAGLAKEIATESEEGFEALAEQLRSRMGVIPFIGAGMSKGFGLAD